VRALVLASLVGALLSEGAFAEDSRPPILREIGFDQRLGESVPLGIILRDEEGHPVRFGDLFAGRPVILSLNYYACPMLCTVTLSGLASALNVLRFNAGKEFEIVTLSFDPKETADLAAAKKKTYLARYGRPDAAQGWRFLTGDETAIAAITRAVGFRYAWDSQTQQVAHPAGLVILTPEGRIARYLYGVEYAPNDLRLALIEASARKIGSPVDQFVLFCYQYDPTTGRYGAAIMRMVRVGGILTVAGILTLLVTLRRRERALPTGERAG
jgi:protein SCO1/2